MVRYRGVGLGWRGEAAFAGGGGVCAGSIRRVHTVRSGHGPVTRFARHGREAEDAFAEPEQVPSVLPRSEPFTRMSAVDLVPEYDTEPTEPAIFLRERQAVADEPARPAARSSAYDEVPHHGHEHAHRDDSSQLDEHSFEHDHAHDPSRPLSRPVCQCSGRAGLSAAKLVERLFRPHHSDAAVPAPKRAPAPDPRQSSYPLDPRAALSPPARALRQPALPVGAYAITRAGVCFPRAGSTRSDRH